MTVRSHATTRQTWAERIERFAQSDVSVAEFCAAEGVSAASFYQWRRKLRADATTAPAVNRFVPVTLRSVTPAQPVTVMSVELPGGARVRFEVTGGAQAVSS